MAIIEVYHGVKVSIRDARDPWRDLPEYRDNSAAASSLPSSSLPSSSSGGALGLTRYIACRDAQAFLVHLSVSNAYDFARPQPHSLNLAVFIDGVWAAGKLCRAPDVKTQPFRANVDHRLHKYFDGTLVRQPFVFSGLKTVDDTDEDRLEAEVNMASTLGTIEIRVFRVEEQGIGSFRSAGIGPRAFELAEVSLKGRAVTHGTVFGDGANLTNEDANNDAMMRHKQCNNLDKHPIAIYRYKYRSPELLQLMGVISKQDLLARVEQEEEHTPLNGAHESEGGRPRSRCHDPSKRRRNTQADQQRASSTAVVDLTDEPPSKRARQRGDGAQTAIDLTDD